MTVASNKGLKFSEDIYGKNDYVDYMIYLFIATAQKDFPEEIDVPNHAWDQYIDELYKYTGQRFIPKKNYTDCIKHTDIKKNDKKVVVGFSGGKDSTATSLYFKLNGKEIDLFHVKGLNRSYRHEDVASQDVASHLGLNLIDVNVKMTGKILVNEDGSDNAVRYESPIKNEFILSLMIEHMMSEEITECALGIFYNDGFETTHRTNELSDVYKFNRSFEKAVQYTFPEFHLNVVFRNGVHSLAYIAYHDRELINLYQSCMTRDMYRNNLRTLAENKYGVTIPNNKCMSCYKCCAEYIILHSLGVISLDKKIILEKLIPILKKRVDKLSDSDIGSSDSLSMSELLSIYMDLKSVQRYKKDLSLVDKDIAINEI